MAHKTYNRFNIDDKTLEKIAPHLTGQCRQRGGIAKDKRKFINSVVKEVGDSALKIY